MQEKIYKTMKNTGIANLVFGIISIIAGVTVGVISIVSGARLLSSKKKIIF
ncbi:MAG: hypothetical protein MRZ59_06710 [Clostridiales bacterium]|nr:hypothetical protein [Clostridiales bacterium]MDY3746071.1 hypothetical protein [Lachnospiraceae bacterium]